MKWFYSIFFSVRSLLRRLLKRALICFYKREYWIATCGFRVKTWRNYMRMQDKAVLTIVCELNDIIAVLIYLSDFYYSAFKQCSVRETFPIAINWYTINRQTNKTDNKQITNSVCCDENCFRSVCARGHCPSDIYSLALVCWLTK